MGLKCILKTEKNSLYVNQEEYVSLLKTQSVNMSQLFSQAVNLYCGLKSLNILLKLFVERKI